MKDNKREVLKGGFHRKRFPIGEHRETQLNQICPTARENFPFYFRLPYWDPIALLKWRRYVRNRCKDDLIFRAAIWEACRQDVAFFCVTFVWIFEPRPRPRKMPFHPFTSQLSLLSWFVEIFGERSGAVNKTRGIGLSWAVAAFIKHSIYFEPEATVALLTEDERKLDAAEGSNSSIGKLQYIHDHMPTWARYTKAGKPLIKRSLGEHTYANQSNGARVEGYVATGTKLRQLRFTFLFADEFAFYPKHSQEEWMAASGGTCSSRLFGSTWNDFDDMFHHIMYEEQSSLLRMSAFWWNDYERWKGAYKMEGGRVILVDKDYKHLPDYAFGEPGLLDDGMLRSPWVDGELLEPGVDKIKTLRDLYGMTVCERTNAFFAGEVRTAIRQTVREPDKEGTYHKAPDGKVVIQPTKKSEIRLWGGVPENNRGPYTCFCDLGGGAGLAFSTACFLDKAGEQVCEFGTNQLDLPNFAQAVVAICRWLAGVEGDGWVLLDAEATGPFIKPFITECLRLHYGNLWMSEVIDMKTKKRKIRQGEIPSYYGTVNRDGGMANFREFARAVMDMEVLIHSELVADDVKRCSRDEEKGGRPKFAKPTGNKGHGDFLYAAAGAWWRARSFIDAESRGNDEGDEDQVQYRKEPWETETRSRWSDQFII